jgi:DNA-binding NarL/FixJ family response regulator
VTTWDYASNLARYPWPYGEEGETTKSFLASNSGAGTLQINCDSRDGSSAETTARSLAHRSPDVETPSSAVPRAAQASVNDWTLVAGGHRAKKVISDSGSGGRTSSKGDAVLAELAAGVTDSVCGPLGGNGLHGMRDRWREPLGRDTQLTNGARSDSARSLAEGHGILGDVRVLIVDDSTLYREYLAGVVVAHGMVSSSVAWDLASLITAIEIMKPRVILLNMATRDSTMLLRHALQLSPTVRVIVMGMSEDDESEIVACAEAGVAGYRYHLRTESLGDLLDFIRQVAAGEALCSPRVSANSASPVMNSRLTATTGAKGTSSYRPARPRSSRCWN